MMQIFRDRLGRLLGRRPDAMQVAALCICRDSRRVLLITSRGTGRWILPKGWPMPGRSMAEAAAQEAWEEAGVKGRLLPHALGSYSYQKQQDRGFAIPVRVQVYGIEVEELDKGFPEADQRERKWFGAQDASDLVEEPGLKALLRRMPAPTR